MDKLEKGSIEFTNYENDRISELDKKQIASIQKMEKSQLFLTTLYLSSQGLTELPDLPNELKELNCADNNNLETLPELPDGLRTLYCFANSLTTLPELPNGLKELSCAANYLETLPELPNGLKKLSCSGNQLETLPELPDGLEELYCSLNGFSEAETQRIENECKEKQIQLFI